MFCGIRDVNKPKTDTKLKNFTMKLLCETVTPVLGLSCECVDMAAPAGVTGTQERTPSPPPR